MVKTDPWTFFLGWQDIEESMKPFEGPVAGLKEEDFSSWFTKLLQDWEIGLVGRTNHFLKDEFWAMQKITSLGIVDSADVNSC